MKKEDTIGTLLKGSRRVVVKVGTMVLVDERGYLEERMVRTLARQVAEVYPHREVFIVTSGAIGAGMAALGMKRRPRTIPELQAAAAVGQGHLMHAYRRAFARYGIETGQVLLTRDDFEDRRRYLNARNTLNALSEMKVIPVINENDAVVTDEIRFSDNDILAALLTNMLRADLLVLLTCVDGVFHPRRHGDEPIPVLEGNGEDILPLVENTRSRLGSGGMKSKLEAASIVTKAGEAVIIANGRRPDTLRRIFSGENPGTLISPAPKRMKSRKRWIGFTARAKGTIIVDAGARRAVESGKSLLPSGITSVKGTFEQGDVVNVEDTSGEVFARGLSNYSATEVGRIKGMRSAEVRKIWPEAPYEEVIRRENLVLIR